MLRSYIIRDFVICLLRPHHSHSSYSLSNYHSKPQPYSSLEIRLAQSSRSDRVHIPETKNAVETSYPQSLVITPRRIGKHVDLHR